MGGLWIGGDIERVSHLRGLKLERFKSETHADWGETEGPHVVRVKTLSYVFGMSCAIG